MDAPAPTSAVAPGLPLASGLNAGPSATTAHMSEGDRKKLKEAAVQLEAVFDGYLMEEFNKGLPGSGSDSFSSQVYADMFKQSIAMKVAQSNSGKGLASQIYNETLRLAASPGASVPKSLGAA